MLKACLSPFNLQKRSTTAVESTAHDPEGSNVLSLERLVTAEGKEADLIEEGIFGPKVGELPDNRRPRIGYRAFRKLSKMYGFEEVEKVAPTIFNAYVQMIYCCYNPMSADYHGFGDKNAYVYQPWLDDFAGYVKDVVNFKGAPDFIREEAKAFQKKFCRRFRNDAVANIRMLESNFPIDQKVGFARQLAHRFASVESRLRDNGLEAGRAAAKQLLTKAVSDRHQAMAQGTNSFLDPRWLLAALTETWACARAGSLNGKISTSAFRKVDREFGRFIIEMLGPDEFQEIARGDSSSSTDV